jgi:hypothetical protein
LRIASNADHSYDLVLRAGKTKKQITIAAGEQTLRL